MVWVIIGAPAVLLGLAAGSTGAGVGLIIGLAAAGVWKMDQWLRLGKPLFLERAPKPKREPTAKPTARKKASREASPLGGARIETRTTAGGGLSITIGIGEREKNEPDDLEWIPPGTPVSVGGRNFDGMIYVSDRQQGWDGEPSAIIRNAKVAPASDDAPDEIPYYPSYERLQRHQRAAYLDWLGRGRSDDEPETFELAYVFMFFYGLERRVLIDNDSAPDLREEVLRMLKVYGARRRRTSLVSYLSDFLHFASYRAGHRTYRKLWPDYLPLHDKSFSETSLTLVLANLHALGEPLHWSIAYRVAMHHDDARKSVVVERTGGHFFEIFRQKFEAAFPDGMPLRAGKRDRTVRYRSANASLSPRYGGGQDAVPPLKVPNVFHLKSQFSKLPMIWNQCIEELSGYSRALARATKDNDVTTKEALKVFLALPAALRNPKDHPLRPLVDDILAACPPEDGLHFVPVRPLRELLGIPHRATLTTTQSRQVAELVTSTGLTLAPDPNCLRLPLRDDQEVAVFASLAADAPTDLLPGLLRLLYLSILVAAADGTVSDEEVGVFNNSCEGLDLSGADRIILSATEAVLLRDVNVASKNLNRIAKSVLPNRKQTVLHLLTAVAGADGVVTGDEHKVLKRIARAMALPDTAVDDILTEDPAFSAVTVVARKNRRRSGEAIPAQPASTPEVFSLNMDLVESISKETREVVSMLSEVLSDDDITDESFEAADPDPTDNPDTATDADWLEELEPRYRGALLELVGRERWDADSVAKLAESHHFMRADLIDSVNAWSDEELGDFLLEEGDGGALNVYRDLLPDTQTVSTI